MSGSGAKLSEEDGKKAEQKSAGGSTFGKWILWGMAIFAVLSIALGTWNALRDRRPGSSSSKPATAVQQGESAGDMTPPPVPVEDPRRDCPPMEMVPPRAHEPVAPSPIRRVREPKEGVDFITLPQATASYELEMPAPGAGGTTIPVRFMPGGGYYLHSRSWPATVKDWNMEEWREGVWLYRRWSHLNGEVNGYATKVLITINGDRR